MELFEAELEAFTDWWTLEKKPKVGRLATAERYCKELRRYATRCDELGLQTVTIRSAKVVLRETAKRSGNAAFMLSRALKSFGKFLAIEYREGDPFETLDYYEQPTPGKQRVTTLDDIRALVATCEDHLRGIRDAAIILALASTGMRRSELARMMWCHVDIASGAVHVPITKNGSFRTVRLGKDARRAMRRYSRALETWECDNHRDRSDEVWCSTTRRTPLTSDGIAQMMFKRAKRAEVDVSAHAFRRGFAIEVLRSGGSETYLMEMAGWKTRSMVAKYSAAVVVDESLAMHARIFG